jgi:hypothetical protein
MRLGGTAFSCGTLASRSGGRPPPPETSPVAGVSAGLARSGERERLEELEQDEDLRPTAGTTSCGGLGHGRAPPTEQSLERDKVKDWCKIYSN